MADEREQHDAASNRGTAADPTPLDDYLEQSKRPLPSLVFLAPLILIYELGALRYAGEFGQTGGPFVEARFTVNRFFEHFGATSYFLPGVLLIIVLVAWHFFERKKARIQPRVILGMAGESFALALPLFVFALVLFRQPMAVPAQDDPLLHVPAAIQTEYQTEHEAAHRTPALPALANQTAPTYGSTSAVVPSPDPSSAQRPAPSTLDAFARPALLSVGAGLYEELLFRLIGIALLHLLLHDIFRVPDRIAAGACVVITAALFTVYHFTESNPYTHRKAIFYFTAGVYLACVYIARGFGIVVGVHALYDIFAHIQQALIDD